MNDYKILVVDDSRDCLALVTGILKKAEYHVRSSENGEVALAAVSAETPDLILLDVKMLGIDGIEVCRRLKKDDKTKDIPVIFMSAATEPKERVEGLSAGAVDYVLKPFNSEELLARIKIHLEMQRLKKVLSHEREKTQSILSNSPVGMIVFNDIRKIIYANPAAETIFNNKASNLERKSCGDFILCEKRRNDPRGCGYSHECAICPIFSSINEILNSNAEQIERDGEALLHIDGNNSPLYTRFKARAFYIEGQRSVLLSIEDITDMKREEEELRKSQFILNETGRMAKVGGWEFDIATQKQIWTEEVYRIHEVDMDFEPTVERGINFYAPASQPIIERVLQLTIEKGDPFDLELEIITAKGNRRNVHSTGKADLEHGKIFGTFQDITDQKKIEKEREALIVQLHDALEKVKQLSGILPICMHCKKIRNDKGYWSQMEAYISEHSEAEFSHGLCSDCAKKYYPELKLPDIDYQKD